jgi:YD repeat-containing protein
MASPALFTLDNNYPNFTVTDCPPQRPTQKAYDYNGSGAIIYIGWAASGIATSAAGWAIKQLVYNGSGQLTQELWANGSTGETNIWNNRTSLSYS